MVPTDFSDHSKNAAHYAVDLARQFNASLTLFHAFTISPASAYPPLYTAGAPGSSMIQDEIIKAELQSRQRLEAFRDIIIKDPHNPCCNLVQRGGFVSESINEFAQEKNFDLIVMSTRGSDSVSDFFIATNTWEVISSGKTAVLAIPDKLPFSPLRHFAFATDFSETDFEALNTILDIAGKFNAKVSVVHAIKQDEKTGKNEELLHDFEDRIRAIRNYHDLKFVLLEDDNIQEALNNFINTNNVSVIALVNRKYNILKNFFHRSLTKKFAYHSKIPLFVFPQKKVTKQQSSLEQQKGANSGKLVHSD